MTGKLTTTLILAAAVVAVALPAMAQDPAHRPGEEAVDPYTVAEANAGVTPFEGTEMLEAFRGREGSDRIVDAMLDRSVADPRIAEIFVATDMVRLRRTLKEQFCYILNGGCTYSGRSMQDATTRSACSPRTWVPWSSICRTPWMPRACRSGSRTAFWPSWHRCDGTS